MIKYKLIFITLSFFVLFSCGDHKPYKTTGDLTLPPVVQITSPEFLSSYVAGSEIFFEANFFSLEESTENWAVTWESDIDGIMFQEDLTGTNISAFSTDLLSNNRHIVSVSFAQPDLDEPVSKHVVIENNLPDYLDYSDFAYLGTFQNSQYFISDSCFTWQAADLLSNINNGHQVTITSENEFDFVWEGFREYYDSRRDSAETYTAWLGLYYCESDSAHVWVTGEVFDYYQENSSYNSEFPYHPDLARPYVIMYRSSRDWTYSENDIKRHLILEIELAEDK